MTSAPVQPLTESRPSWSHALLGLILRPESVTFLILLIALFISTRLSGHFDLPYLLDSTSQFSEIGVMALAMTFVIISGNIDLSVASGLALIAVIAAHVHVQHHWPMSLVIPFALALGLILGLFNGLLVTLIGLPSLTATLGTFALYRGFAQILAGDQSISGFPTWFKNIDQVMLFHIIPLPLMILLALACVFAILLHKTVFGRCVYAIGTNEAASHFSGIRVKTTKLTVFAISGLCMAIGALMMLSRLGGAQYDLSKGDELLVITAVVLGGTSIFGGTGSIAGSVIALFLLCVLRSGMELAEITAEKQLAITGALLIAAVILTNLTTKLLSVTASG
jgi:rhamnose transport system permease protein